MAINIYFNVFLISVFTATVLLICHSYIYRGKRKTLIFWGLGYLILFFREFIYQNVFVGYRFNASLISILNVPIAIPMGWLYCAYISQFIVQYLLGYDFEKLTKHPLSDKDLEEKIFPLYFLSSVITATISFLIENLATRMDWWGDPSIVHEYMYPGWLLGYMITTVWFLMVNNYITYPNFRLKKIWKLLLPLWAEIICREFMSDPELNTTIYKILFICSIFFIILVLLQSPNFAKFFSFLLILNICYILLARFVMFDFMEIISFRYLIGMLFQILLVLSYGYFYLYQKYALKKSTSFKFLM